MMKNQYKDKYSLIGEYTGFYEKTLFKIDRKTHLYTTPRDLLNESFDDKDIIINNEEIFKNKKKETIKVHKKHKNTKTHEQFVKELNDKFGDVYIVLEEYVNSYTKILVEHKCKNGEHYRWRISPDNLLSGKGSCPRCSNRERGIEAYKERVYELYGDEYIVVGQYKGAHENVLMEHNVEGCHHQFETIANYFLNYNCRCPKCYHSYSRGEIEIAEILKNNKINFETQFTFSDCKYKNVLRFDFAIFEDKEKTNLKCLIEYQGEQHYSPQTFNSISKEKAEEIYKENVIKDNIKRKYCKLHNIKLIEIPYWEVKDIKRKKSKKLIKIINNILIDLELVKSSI